eukprot:13648711-Heterocapsa_arctica.AAC.1
MTLHNRVHRTRFGAMATRWSSASGRRPIQMPGAQRDSSLDCSSAAGLRARTGCPHWNRRPR